MAVATVVALPIIAAAQGVQYYHLDGVGNVRALTDQNGQVVERHDLFPFGEEWNPQAATQPRTFTGKERDSETALDYFGVRYYGSKIGRFTTVDPATELQRNLADPQSWNRYAYARNNPLRYVDPDGRSWVTKGVKLIIKGGDVAATFKGVVDDAAVLFSLDPAVGSGARSLAVLSLVSEALPVSGRDVKEGIEFAAKHADDARTFITYSIRDADDKVAYVGRASGVGTPAEVLKRRASSHEHADVGTFKLEGVQQSRAANRGAEDVIYNRERLAAEAEGRTLLNRSNPISERNPPRGRSYIDAYVKEQQ